MDSPIDVNALWQSDVDPSALKMRHCSFIARCYFGRRLSGRERETWMPADIKEKVPVFNAIDDRALSACVT
jgi:hypothetical protein